MSFFRHRGVKEVGGVFLLALSLFIFISLISYHPKDPSFNTVISLDSKIEVKNLMGLVGAYMADGLVQFLGSGGYFIPLFLFLSGFAVFRGKMLKASLYPLSGGILFLLSYSSLIHLAYQRDPFFKHEIQGGGLIGYLVSNILLAYFNEIGAYLVLSTVLIISLMVVTRFSIGSGLKKIFDIILIIFKKLLSIRFGVPFKKIFDFVSTLFKKLLSIRLSSRPKKIKRREVVYDQKEEEPIMRRVRAEPKIEVDVAIKKEEKAAAFPKEDRFKLSDMIRDYQLPSLSLLDDPPPKEKKLKKEDILERSETLEKKLRDFGVGGKIIQVLPGPVVTMYEFEPASGVKVNKIINLVDDIALVTRAANVRIVAPVPGKAVVGIEIPNSEREHVSLKEILGSKAFQRAKSKLSLALGKDILGNPTVTDLAQIPHLLIAGATGSGKSVALNCMICSFLFNTTPEEVKLILIDPKMLELSIYDGIPHLLVPVVTNAKKAALVLRNVVEEMERRYRFLADKEVRDIERYNQIIDEEQSRVITRLSQLIKQNGISKEEKLKSEKDEKLVHTKLPYIVVVIDELADLMMVSSREVEDSLTRLAQMARAAGIHLLVATQRPSVDVLTGVIKANFPSRISFKVSSKVDSRTILDANGAERLLGKGDLLFLPPGTSRLERIHGPYVSEKEVKKVVTFLKKQLKPIYDNALLEQRKIEDFIDDGEDFDEKYTEAVKLVTLTGQASISMIQRRLRVGYNRAARMIELMEKEGIVGPADGVKPRRVFGKGELPN